MKFKNVLLILLFVFATSQYASSKYKSKTIKSIDETSIYYEYAGNGDLAIIFIHGWSCDVSFWEEQMEYFKEEYKVVAIDLAGHGFSGIQRKDYTIQMFGQDVKAVVDDLQLKRIILVGHSMGSAVITEAANLLGNITIALIGSDTFQDVVTKYSEKQKEEFIKPFQDDFATHCPVFVRQMFPQNADSILVNKISTKMCDADEYVALSSMTNMFNYDFIQPLKNIDFPIVTINSRQYPTNIELNRTVIKSFDVKFMDGVGHFVMNEDPQTFNKLLEKTINELKLK